MTDPRIPITVIGGFLGAGKTTLVNHLIRSTAAHFAQILPGRRIGVIINEFGQTGVDGGLIERLSDQPDDVQELTAGCLCCTGRDDLIQALVLLAQRGQSEGDAPAHVLIELSGIADPLPVLETLLDPDVRAILRLDSLITVVDARNLAQTLHENPEGAAQLLYATTVIMNKTDLVTPPVLHQMRTLVQALNPLTHLVEAQRSVVDALALLSTNGFSADWTMPASAAQTVHTRALKSFTLESDTPLSLDGWYTLVRRITSRPGQVLRVKGEVSLEAHPQRLTLHAVRDLITLDPGSEPRTGQTRIVMIGRDLDVNEERAAFALLSQQTRPKQTRQVLRRVPAKPSGVRL
ncbi:CobW family GTP-binding protein [Deinococcus arenicola]|uniref:GTP-binding protein n=1 Tax=Deinococcus arenicola TaxID=2994950 RepID=A0ABU4DUC8_9DEIO|nr:GTP-binding protein [Deinococcus sp. ZS9-10]MDV6376037.1 GTP-binding protein [Deinococcus sp. ZS9-10]